MPVIIAPINGWQAIRRCHHRRPIVLMGIAEAVGSVFKIILDAMQNLEVNIPERHVSGSAMRATRLIAGW
jgi:hypothetical protein